MMDGEILFPREQTPSLEDFVSALANFDEPEQLSNVQIFFLRTLNQAAENSSVSGQLRLFLCGLVKHCSQSELPTLRIWASSTDVCLKLFDYYLEWNEDDRRSMKQILELIVSLMAKQITSAHGSSILKSVVLDKLMAVISGNTTLPLGKSSVKTLDQLFSKGFFAINEIGMSYGKCINEPGGVESAQIWLRLIHDLLDWMNVRAICPTAGKILVALYQSLRKSDLSDATGAHHYMLTISDWHKCLSIAIQTEPSLLEGVKNYIFQPIFKTQRADSVSYLSDLSLFSPSQLNGDEDMSMDALVYLTALEVGKRVGIVEEPGYITSTSKKMTLVLSQDLLGKVIAHSSRTVRSLALSLVVASPSTSQPFSPTVIRIVKENFGAYFADPDAKFRVGVISFTKVMYRRLRGAIFSLSNSRRKHQGPESELDYKTPQIKVIGEDAIWKLTHGSTSVEMPRTVLLSYLEEHKLFLASFFRFLTRQLVPTSSYQCHIAALKTLNCILKMEVLSARDWESGDDTVLFFNVFDHTWRRLLQDLLLDPFEDVRNESAQAITILFGDQRFDNFRKSTSLAETGSPSLFLREVFSRGEKRATRTARADYADGIAKVCQLLYKCLHSEKEGLILMSSIAMEKERLYLMSGIVMELECRIDLAETDLGQAVQSAPIHGNFAAIRCIWEAISQSDFGDGTLVELELVCDRVISCCERAWRLVKDVLCDDSPEGNLLEDIENTGHLDTKELLSYSFRAILESSQLMRVVGSGATPTQQRPSGIRPPFAIFRRIGNLTFQQLSQLRHRGALSTVSVTFAACCQIAPVMESPEIDTESMLAVWYRESLWTVHRLSSTTRRSAGIPAMFVGLILAGSSQLSFEEIIEELLSIALQAVPYSEDDLVALPQVHAHNCLREVFKSSAITGRGYKPAKYISRCFELAAESLKSQVWAIRNCGLLLMRALVDCLFGTQESKLAIEGGWDGKETRIHYHKYSSLPRVLVNLLQNGQSDRIGDITSDGQIAAESVFPALDIIRRAGPPASLRLILQECIIKYLASREWYVREMASRTLCSCLLHIGWLDEIEAILQLSLETQDDHYLNRIHGAYLAFYCIVEKIANVMPQEIRRNLERLWAILGAAEQAWQGRAKACPHIIGSHLAILNRISIWELVNDNTRSKLRTTEFTFRIPDLGEVSPTAVHLRRQINQRLVLYAAQVGNLESLKFILSNATCHGNAQDITTILETVPLAYRISHLAVGECVKICDLYMETFLNTEFMETRTALLSSIAALLDHILPQWHDEAHPAPSLLVSLWPNLMEGALCPSLSDVVIRSSGAVLSCLILSSRRTGTDWPGRILQWSRLIAEAGKDYQGFDTRFAAAHSLKSLFSSVAWSHCPPDALLPCALTLYDALNDDDDEIRDVAMSAAARFLGQGREPIAAAGHVLGWLKAHLGRSQAFRTVVAHRVAGIPVIIGAPEALPPWESATTQLVQALQEDDALFVVEEQNLFVDEVREARRWTTILADLLENESTGGREDACTHQLRDWTSDGLDALVDLAQQKGDDGPLGWTWRPQVFAICARIILSAAAFARAGHGPDTFTQGLQEFRQVADLTRVSGQLLDMMEPTVFE